MDRRQIFELEPRRRDAARPGERERARAHRPVGIGQDVDAGELHEQGRVTDPRHGRGAAIVEDGRQIAGDRREARGPGRERGGEDARDEEREARPGAGRLIRRVRVGEPVRAVMGGRAGHRSSDPGAAGREQDQQEGRGRAQRQAAGSPSGSSTTNDAPPPSQFSARSTPPSSATIPYDTESPRPLPSPGGLVVKNGSKIRGRASSGIPGPVSRTSTQAWRSDGHTRTVRTRCDGCLAIAWCAFWTRLSSTTWSWFSSAHTNGHEAKSVTT